MPGHILPYMLMYTVSVCFDYVRVIFVVWIQSSSCCMKNAAASKRSDTKLQVPVGRAQREGNGGLAGRKWPIYRKTPGHFRGSQLCACDGTCTCWKLSCNYTLLSMWPIIFVEKWKAEAQSSRRMNSARALSWNEIAENFQQKEKGSNQVHINQSVFGTYESQHIKCWVWDAEKSKRVQQPWLCLYFELTKKSATWKVGEILFVCLFFISIWLCII